MKDEKVANLKNEFYIDSIKGIMDANNGYVTSKQITELGIHRMYLNMMVDKNIIERVANGIYLDVNKLEDSYYIFSISTPNAIFSHMTALYFYGLSIKAPNNGWDITIRRYYHNPRIAKHNIFYVNDDVHSLGLTEVETPMGNKVRTYDIERCICDIIRSKNRMDMEHVKYSVKEYLKRKDKDLIKLSKYADRFGVKEEVMDFVSMMYD
jgi:predicted transcriptional regulator of viral defense system